MAFHDRIDAGRQLALWMLQYRDDANLLILGLPRGGVIVAAQVAEALRAPLDVLVVCKIGAPGREELAVGAIASGNVMVRNRSVLKSINIPETLFHVLVQRQYQELIRRERLYRGEAPPPTMKDRPIILVDDGLATGATMQAAVKAVRRQQPAKIVIGVPVATPSTCANLRPWVEDLICLNQPEPLHGVSQWYADFGQVTDEEVRSILEEARYVTDRDTA